MEPPVPWLFRMFSTVGSSKNLVNEFFERFGDLSVFLWRVAWAAVTPPFEFCELFRQLDEIGSKSCRWSHWPAGPSGSSSRPKPAIA
jgi:ABC-type transporter Mla maintaining outer membrane lipid asymmetry permease subunit MlaE